MNGSMTLQAFISEVERREASKQDLLAPSRVISMVHDEKLDIGSERFEKITPLAHGQLASRLAIPKDFYDALPDRSFGLRSEIVNRLLREKPDQRRMVRTLDGNVRAVLSDSFKPFDHMLALSATLPVLKEFPDMEVRASDLSDRRMYLQLTFPRFKGEVKVGDPVQYGLTITNSEVGLGNVNVETLLWRLICSNGAISQSILKKRHTGKRLEGNEENDEDFSIYQNDTMNAEMQSFRLRLRDLVAAALNERAWEDELIRLRVLAGSEVKKPDLVIQNITSRFQLTEGDGKLLLENLMTGKDYSPWGVVNAITALSHSTSNLDSQYSYEKLGAEVIRLSPKDWEVLQTEKAVA